jgi:hypothetical protein
MFETLGGYVLVLIGLIGAIFTTPILFFIKHFWVLMKKIGYVFGEDLVSRDKKFSDYVSTYTDMIRTDLIRMGENGVIEHTKVSELIEKIQHIEKTTKTTPLGLHEKINFLTRRRLLKIDFGIINLLESCVELSGKLNAEFVREIEEKLDDAVEGLNKRRLALVPYQR